MSTFTFFLFFVQACVIQAALGCGCNGGVPAPLSNISPVSSLGYSAYPGRAGLGSSASFGAAGQGYTTLGGTMDVIGVTNLQGAIPVTGAVNFGGPVNAAGAVTISGSCGGPYLSSCGCN